MTEQQSPVEQALEFLLYAPVGIAMTLRDEFPKMVEKGRQQVAGQLLVARMAGEFALGQVQRDVERLLQQAGERLQELQEGGRLATGGPAPAPPPPAAQTPPAAPSTPARPATVVASSQPPDLGESPRPWPAPGAVDVVAGDGARSPSLAIPGYDVLSASQVVQRLAGLSPDELEEVRLHEVSHRGRKTILTRIHQLQGGA